MDDQKPDQSERIPDVQGVARVGEEALLDQLIGVDLSVLAAPADIGQTRSSAIRTAVVHVPLLRGSKRRSGRSQPATGRDPPRGGCRVRESMVVACEEALH